MPTIPIKYFLYFGAAIVLALGCWHLHYIVDKGGYDRAMQEVAAKQVKAHKKLTSIKKDTKNELQNADRDALIREFCATKRVRNPEHCPK